MNDSFRKIIDDFAKAMEIADSRRPVWQSLSGKKTIFKPGIGPHPETKTIELVKQELTQLDTNFYKRIETQLSYPKGRKTQFTLDGKLESNRKSRTKCDIKFSLENSDCFSEVKLWRPLGNNGKENNNIFTHIFSPYPHQNSALTDISKLRDSNFDGIKSIIIICYQSEKFPLEESISLFEMIANNLFSISQRYESSFNNLVHDVHNNGKIIGWIID